jgi:hypothetical protein
MLLLTWCDCTLRLEGMEYLSELDMTNLGYTEKRISSIRKRRSQCVRCFVRRFGGGCACCTSALRFCLSRGGKFWKQDLYEKDITLYLVNVKSTVSNRLDTTDEVSVAVDLAASPELAQLMVGARSMSLQDGDLPAPALGSAKPSKRVRGKNAEGAESSPDKPKASASQLKSARGVGVADRGSHKKDLVRFIGAAAGLQVEMSNVPFTAEYQPQT